MQNAPQRRNKQNQRKWAPLALAFTLTAFATSCAQPVTHLTVPTRNSQGVSVAASGDTCRVPSGAVAAITGNYSAQVRLSNGESISLSWTLSAETVAGFSGQFLKSQMTLNGSRGNSQQTSLLCTETVSQGSALSGLYMHSEPVAFSPMDYLFSGGQILTSHQMGVISQGGGVIRFDPSQSWLEFLGCSGVNCATTIRLSSQVSGLQKL